MLRSVFLSFTIFSLVSLTGCMPLLQGYVVSNMKEEPVCERFYIHPEPKVGDTAFYTSDNEHMKGNGSRVTLISREEGVNMVALEPENRKMLNFRKLYWVTDDGIVIKAQLEYKGEITPLKVEGENPETGYFRRLTFERCAVPQRFEAKGRSYTVKYIQTQQMVHHSGDPFFGTVDADMTQVNMYDPDVPFGLVKTVLSGKTKAGAGAFDFIGAAIKATQPDIFSSREVLNDLYTSSKSSEHAFIMDFNYTPE
ncbi:hypothetical protein [Desulfoluna spongiiphila]|uniref:Lipoprotein n=1 Tax=Desulfoluna spongiiphila TaxID=419481 RepID=A0A1G5FG15_9BACT|nr:hypothetical protein [Desulfoluna spongiiphila]SCY37820.1 hypothetical protein SAMN05216233_10833 [Desulfoluna spongiiphila]